MLSTFSFGVTLPSSVLFRVGARPSTNSADSFVLLAPFTCRNPVLVSPATSHTDPYPSPYTSISLSLPIFHCLSPYIVSSGGTPTSLRASGLGVARLQVFWVDKSSRLSPEVAFFVSRRSPDLALRRILPARSFPNDQYSQTVGTFVDKCPFSLIASASRCRYAWPQLSAGLGAQRCA